MYIEITFLFACACILFLKHISVSTAKEVNKRDLPGSTFRIYTFLLGGKQPLLQRDLRHSGEHPATVWNRTHLCHHRVSSGRV